MSKDNLEAHKLTVSKAEMQSYGYKIVDAIVEHFDTQDTKNPVVTATREEMDNLFLENVPEGGTDAHQVLDFVMDDVYREGWYATGKTS